MKEILYPFRQKKSVLQILLCTAIFIGMAVPFKVMVLVDGFTEVRPVNAVPVVAGLIFGPMGAWGCAIGNLIADLFGTFSKASILGFFGNFIAAYLPYKLWHTLKKGEKPNVKSYVNIGIYILISFASALSTGIFIVCGLYYLMGLWSLQLFYIIILNDFIFPIFIGLPVLIVLTCEDNNVTPHMPKFKNAHQKIERVCILVLFAALTALLIVFLMGLSISAFVVHVGMILFVVSLSVILFL